MKPMGPGEVLAVDKWVENVGPEDRTSVVAARTLESRLEALLHYLRLAAREDGADPEDVHQLRVWSRRSAAALALYEPMLPHRRAQRIRRALRMIRHAANDARDCDVLLERLAHYRQGRSVKYWQTATRRSRAEAQRTIVKVHHKLCVEGDLAKQVKKLIERIREQERKHDAWPRFGVWARRRLRPVIRRFFALAPSRGANAEDLHQFRIAGKELRYGIEMLAGAFGDEMRTELYPVIEEIQDRLGHVNDLATAQARLKELIAQTSDARIAAGLRRLLASETAEFARARRVFLEWCSRARMADLCARFVELAGRRRRAKPVSSESPLEKRCTMGWGEEADA